MSKKLKEHGTGYRVFHTILCVLATLILVCCILSTAIGRFYVKSDKLPAALNATQLGSSKLPFSGQTVGEKIHENFNISEKNNDADQIERLIDQMNITGYLAEKLQTHFEMLRGNSDSVVSISTDDFVDMLFHTNFIITNSELNEFRAEIDPPVSKISGLLDFCYARPVLRTLARYRVSIARIIVDIVLLILLLVRWMQICRATKKPRTRAVKGMAITIICFTGIFVIICLASLIDSLFVKDSVKSLNELVKTVRTPFTIYNGAALLTGILMLVITKLITDKAAKKAALPDKNTSVKSDVKMESAPEVPTPTAHCIYCKRTIKEGAKFCIFCGKSQTPETETPAADTPEDSAAPNETDAE